jgi:uncharacterized hydantoinase/oxoprolinase family protein
MFTPIINVNMSSYFDMMCGILNDSTKVIDLAEKQYQQYLSYLSENVTEADEEKLSTLITKFYGIRHNVEKRGLGKEWILEEMHDLAHDIGRANIRLKDGSRAGDNPNVYY